MEDNIYIIRVFGRNGEAYIKVGYSSNIKSRLQHYYSHNPLVEVVLTVYNSNAMQLERDLHRNFDSIIMNEWYKDEQLLEIINYISSYGEGSSYGNSIMFSQVYFDLAIPSHEHKEILNKLLAKEYVLFMRLCFMADKKTLKIPIIKPDISARRLEDAFGVHRNEVKGMIGNLLSESLILLANDSYFINDNYLKPI